MPPSPTALPPRLTRTGELTRARAPHSRWRNFVLFLSVMGPGIITANVDNDAGGITTYSVVGAQFGTRLLWSLIPITLALIVVQEMGARMGAITGKGLSDLIREHYGVRVTFWILLAMLVCNWGNTVAEFSGIASSLEIFGIPAQVSVPVCAILVWLLVTRGNARSVEKLFLVACVFYVAYPISGFLAHPPWKEMLVATVVPQWENSRAFVSILIGTVGTTIAPWMQFYLQSAVVEKGVSAETYALSRLDVIVGCIVTDVVAFFIIVACAVTLNRHGIHIESAKDAALALEPLAGKYASRLFSFGLFNASFFAASILPLSTAYLVCEGFGWESGIGKPYKDARQFFWLFTGMVVLGAGVVLIPHLPLIRIMLFTQVINGILLPFILVFMLLLINKENLMGRAKNGPWFNGIAWATTVIMVVLTGYLVVTGVQDLFT